jgi:uncharacterized membrane protein
LLGFLDLGRGLFYYSSLTNAVREGTRRGIVIKTNEEDLKLIVLEYAFGLTTTNPPLTANDISVSTTAYDETNVSLKITANYCFVPVTPGIAALIGNNCTGGGSGIKLTAESAMRFEAGIW